MGMNPREALSTHRSNNKKIFLKTKIKIYGTSEKLKNWKEFLLFSIISFFTVPRGSLNKPDSIFQIFAAFGR